MISRENVEQTLYELVRLELVKQGYLPDITTLTSQEYKAAKAALESQHKLIEVYGVSAPQGRGEVEKNRIFWDTAKEEDGSYTSWPEVAFNRLESGRFQKVQAPEQLTTLRYELRYITSSVAYDRILGRVIDTALGSRRSIVLLDDEKEFNGPRVWLMREGSDRVPGMDFIERLYRFTVPDVQVQDSTNIGDPVAAITSVGTSINDTQVIGPPLLPVILGFFEQQFERQFE